MTELHLPAIEEERPMGLSLRRGLMLRCPACGKGHILTGYLTVHDACPACGEVLSHHRADDGPAYLTILIVGHLMAPLLLWAFVTFRPTPLTLMAIFMTGTVALSLFLLPRFKGMIVALQWAKEMHGFGAAARQARGEPALVND